MTSTPLFTVRQTTDNIDVEEVISGWYEEPKIEFDKPPEFNLIVPNRSGIELYRLFAGKEIQIKRAGTIGMTGVIDTPKGNQGMALLSKNDMRGVHKGYVFMDRLECADWSFSETAGNSSAIQNTRSAVIINPWDYFVFRAPSGNLGVDGLPPAVDGVLYDDAFRTLAGVKAIMQMDYGDNSFFLPSQVYASSNNTQVYRDGASSQLRPALQRVRTGNTFLAGTNLESIPWQQNSPDVSAMGTISTITATFYGKRDSNSRDIIVDVCRNASAGVGSRTYTNLPLSFTSNASNGLDSWTGTVTLSGSEAVQNSLGFRINFGGLSSDTVSSFVYYGRLDAVVTSETGVKEGSMSVYSNPYTFSGGAQNWVESSVQGMTRMKAGETLRLQTVSDPAVNPNPCWDLWIDGNLNLNFSQRRGSSVNRTYSFPNQNLKEVVHEFDGTQLAYQTIAYGTGSGASRNAFLVRDPTLYDADRDPFGATRKYGDLPRVMSFTDSNERSMVTLLRKAQAYHKLHRDPIEKLSVKITAEPVPYFQTGDSITIDNMDTRTLAATRVQSIKRSFGGGINENVDIVLGNVDKSLNGILAGNKHTTQTIVLKPSSADAASGLSGNGVYFDATHFGAFSFPIDDGSQVDKVLLHFNILPWQATSKSSAAGQTGLYNSGGDTKSFTANSGFNHSEADVLPFTSNNDIRNIDFIEIDFNLYDQNSVVNDSTHNFDVDIDLKWSSTPSGAVTQTTSSVLAMIGDASLNDSHIRRQLSPSALASLGTNYYLRGYNVLISDHSAAAWSGANFQRQVTVRLTSLFKFGIFQFDGDSGNGTGPAIYGTGIKFAVDPPTISNGLPTNFAAESHPASIGNSQSVPTTMDVDVTGYLAADTNALVKSGIHTVYLQGATGQTNNAGGLSVASVSPILRLKQNKVT